MGNLAGGYNKADSSTDVWGAQAPFLQELFGRGQGLSQGFAPDQGAADLTRQAWQQQMQPQANPYLGQMAGQFQDQLGMMNQQSGGQAGLSGGYGGGRHGVAEALNTKNMGQQMGQFYGGQYQQDMNRQQGAMGMGQNMLGMQAPGQQWGNLGNYQSILGSPIMTSNQTSRGWDASLGAGK